MEENIQLEYNTSRERLTMPEYGRGVLKMVEHLLTIEDKAKRTEQARAVIKSMEILNPQVRQQENWEQKLWDHLFILSGFQLDVDSPYPLPTPEQFETKPIAIPMKGTKIRAAHYGRNIERIIDLLTEEPDGPVKTAMIRNLALYMRTQYLIWNKDNVADETIFADLEKLSDYRIKVPADIEPLSKIAADGNYNRPGMGAGVGETPKKKRNNGRRNGKNRR